MSALDDLKAEVVALNTSFSAELDAVNAKLAAIPAGTSDAQIASVTADLKTLQGKIDAATATFAPAPPPAPAP